MSQRSFSRAVERRTAKERRRETLRRRRAGLATGAAIGAAALGAPAAYGAALPPVNTLADGPADACDATDCKLRDAITDANATAEPDTITFASGLSGQIVLTEGQLSITNPLTITGPGRELLSISGDNDANGLDAGDYRIFNTTAPATISRLTLTEGASIASEGSGLGPGGAVNAGADLTIADAIVAGNSAAGSNGGGIFAGGDVTIVRSRVNDNDASSGGGIFVGTSGSATVDQSEVNANDVTGARGAGIAADGALTVVNSSISGNVGADNGGGIQMGGKYAPLEITGSTIHDNDAAYGGGIAIEPQFGKYSSGVERLIARTTISANGATEDGGGLYVPRLGEGDELTISRSTISGNTAAETGGGMRIGPDGPYGGLSGNMLVSNSTVSGNTANTGAGAAIGGAGDGAPLGGGGSLEFANSTIAANDAGARGDGLYLGSYDAGSEGEAQTSPTVPLTSTIVGDNVGQDLARAENSQGGGFDLAFSLVEEPGTTPLFQSEDDFNIVGVDPQLGPLADNDGPTRTHLPASTSPAIDRGDAPARLDNDQRGRQRTQDGAPPNPSGGDGTDIGSVEIDAVPASEAPPTVVQGPAGPATETLLPRVNPRGIRVRVSPGKDTTVPFTFTTTGRILPPVGMSNAEACGSVGFVSVQVKRKGVTISNRRTQVRPSCRFRSQVTFKYRQRFGSARNLKFVVRFTGNDRLEAIAARSIFRPVR